MKLLSWLLLPLIVAAALLLHEPSASPDAAASAGPLPEFAPGELLLKARPGVSESAAVAATAARGAHALDRAPELGVYRIALPPGEAVEDAVQRFEALPWVEFAEPNYYVHADIVPNDTFYAGNQSWYYNLMQGPAAWDITTGAPGVIVAVADTGVDLDHPDLAANMWTNSGEIPANGIDDDGNTVTDDRQGAAYISFPTKASDSPGFSNCTDPQPANNPQDDEGHGTMTAGIVGARTNNSQGVAGTAWNVTLMPVKVLDCNGVGTTWDLGRGIRYAAKNGAKVISMSLAGPRGNSPAPCGSLNAYIEEAAQTYGAVLVAAAGNDGINQVKCPAAHPNVIAVGASAGPTNVDTRAGFSNWGPEIDVAAPGVSICSTYWNGALQPPSDATYLCGDGTSFSTPLVSGLAALILSWEPAFGPTEVGALLCESAVDLPDGSAPNWDGCGRISMKATLTVALVLFASSTASDCDFNGDGKDDLAVGAPLEDIGTIADGGAVNVLYGSGSGLTAAGNQLWHQDLTGVIGDAETGDLFGSSLACGDFNGDGKDDLAIGAPLEDIGSTTDGGAVNVLYGSGSGLTAAGNQLWHQDLTGVAGDAETGDVFGHALASGDFNGDGKDDMAIGAPLEDIGTEVDAGAASVIYGTGSRLTPSGGPGDQLWYQGLSGIQGKAEAGDLFGISLGRQPGD